MTLNLGILGCNSKTEKMPGNSASPNTANDDIKLHKLNKLFVVGDFDGDGKRDTIHQHHFSRQNNSEIEYSADPFQNEWDTVINWFYNQDVNVYLTINKSNRDTLYLGTAQGLYCLINAGDNNSDGKDEIAFVIDYLDMSRLNSCFIYSLCRGKWTELKQFNIHEGAFDFVTDRAPVFDHVKDFLERRKGRWVYKDYLEDSAENADDIGEMTALKLNKCK